MTVSSLERHLTYAFLGVGMLIVNIKAIAVLDHATRWLPAGDAYRDVQATSSLMLMTLPVIAFFVIGHIVCALMAWEDAKWREVRQSANRRLR